MKRDCGWVAEAAELRRAANIRDANAAVPRIVNSGVAENLGVGLGSGRRCAIAMEQWLCAAHRSGKSTGNAQERQYRRVHAEMNANDWAEEDQDCGYGKELYHAPFQ